MVPEALQRFARAAADFATNGKLGKLEFARDARGRPDVAAFDFTSMMRAESSARVQEKHGARLLLGLVGDCLVEVSLSGGYGSHSLGGSSLIGGGAYKVRLLWEELRGSMLSGGESCVGWKRVFPTGNLWAWDILIGFSLSGFLFLIPCSPSGLWALEWPEASWQPSMQPGW